MFLKNVNSLISRLFFGAAFLLLLLAVLERVFLSFGYTIVGRAYAPGRMLEFAGVLVLFVVALLLRQIRDSATA